MYRGTVTLCGAFLASPALGNAAADPARKGLNSFETKIRPVPVNSCYTCDSADAKTRMGGLSLDTRDGIRRGGQRGHAVVPTDVLASLIIEALRYEGSLRMPPAGRLPEEVVANFEKWIRMGAPDPREVEVASAESSINLEEARKYWAFLSPKGRPPAVRNRSGLK